MIEQKTLLIRQYVYIWLNAYKIKHRTYRTKFKHTSQLLNKFLHQSMSQEQTTEQSKRFSEVQFDQNPLRKIVKKTTEHYQSDSDGTQSLSQSLSSQHNSNHQGKFLSAPQLQVNQLPKNQSDNLKQISNIQKNPKTESAQFNQITKIQNSSEKSDQNGPQKSAVKKKIHIVAVSDNHGDYKAMNQILALQGDIFIHAGDFTYQGKDEDFNKFFSFLDKLNFKHKIVISGNHENVLSKFKLKTVTKMSRQNVISELKKRSIYLQHEPIQIEGIKIFASPFTPEYCQKPISRAFQYKPSQDKLIWSTIPKDTQLLITHGPPYGILDSGKEGKKAGSQGLKEVVAQIKPKYHVFGHIHESKGGMTKINDTIYINLCNTPTRLVMEV